MQHSAPPAELGNKEHLDVLSAYVHKNLYNP